MCQLSMLWWNVTRGSGELQGAWQDGKSLGASPLTWPPPPCSGSPSRWVGIGCTVQHGAMVRGLLWFSFVMRRFVLHSPSLSHVRLPAMVSLEADRFVLHSTGLGILRAPAGVQLHGGQGCASLWDP